MEPNAARSTSSATPVPIPRTGLRGSSGILLFLAFTLSCAVMGITICAMRTTVAMEVRIAEIVSGVASVLLCLHAFRISRRAKGILPFLILAAVMLAYLCNSLLPAALLIALASGVASGALLFSVITKKQAVFLPLIPLLAYGVTLLSSRDIVGSVACLIPLLPAAALAFGTARSAADENGPDRVGVICLSTIALLLSLGGMAAISLYRQLGALDIQTLTAALDSVRESIIVRFTSYELPEGTTQALRDMFSRENVEMVVNYTVNLLPAIVIVLLNLISVVSQMLLHASLVAFGCGSSLTDRVRLFRMSAVSCIAFVVAYLVALFENAESSTLAGTVAENIYLILIPGLAFAGFLRLLAFITRRRMGCTSFLVIFVLPFAVLMMPVLLAVIAPLLAILEVLGRLGAFLKEAFRSDEDEPNDPPGSDP